MERIILGYVVFILAAMQLILVAAAGTEHLGWAFVHSFTASVLFVVSVWMLRSPEEKLFGNPQVPRLTEGEYGWVAKIPGNEDY